MKIIRWLLLALAAAALAFCVFTGYQYMTFQTRDYTDRVMELNAETKKVKDDTQALLSQLKEHEAELSADLSLAGSEGTALQERISELETVKADKQGALAEALERAELFRNLPERVLALRDEYAGKIRQLEDMINAGETDVKICYWTFDDGPGTQTASILDFCREKGVYVTFFTSREANETGNDDVDEPELLRREAMGGHSIQNHTNSHQYSMIAGNLYTQGIDSFREQVRLQDEWITENTGIKPDIFRFPGGSAHAFLKFSREELESVLSEMGYVWIDWSCDIYDNGKAGQTVYDEYVNSVYEIKTLKIAVMLSHDWNPNTLAAFQRAVPELQNAGYVFLPLFSRSWTIGNTTILFS